MTIKTQYCDECQHWVVDASNAPFRTCNKGHKPRLYMPKGAMDTDWGYKRKCKDFDLGDHVKVVKI